MDRLAFRPPGGERLTLFVADRFGQRLLGLAGLRTLPPATGLLIPRCRSVHTFGMRFPIDVLFVTMLRDGLLHVHEARLAVPPCRVVRCDRQARLNPRLAAIELPSRC